MQGVRIRALWCRKDNRTVLGADTHHRIRAYSFEVSRHVCLLMVTGNGSWQVWLCDLLCLLIYGMIRVGHKLFSGARLDSMRK